MKKVLLWGLVLLLSSPLCASEGTPSIIPGGELVKATNDGGEQLKFATFIFGPTKDPNEKVTMVLDKKYDFLTKSVQITVECFLLKPRDLEIINDAGVVVWQKKGVKPGQHNISVTLKQDWGIMEYYTLHVYNGMRNKVRSLDYYIEVSSYSEQGNVFSCLVDADENIVIIPQPDWNEHDINDIFFYGKGGNLLFSVELVRALDGNILLIDTQKAGFLLSDINRIVAFMNGKFVEGNIIGRYNTSNSTLPPDE